MPDTLLRKYLQSVNPAITDEILELLMPDFNYSEFQKQEFLIEENKKINRTYFLESGYVNAFVLDQDGVEVTTHIYSAPCFVNDFTSFFKRLPSTQSYRAITDCVCRTMSFEKVEQYFHNIIEFREFGRLLVLEHYDKLNERMLEMIKDSAETRYVKLLSTHPEILQNVPLKIIASYLGVTDTSLSRIRKDLFKK